MAERTYWERTDSFEKKLKLLEAAWAKGDYRLARSLTHSLRTTAIQAQAEREETGQATLDGAAIQPVSQLPAEWRAYAQGWTYVQAFTIAEVAGVNRPPEPVELGVKVPAEQCASLLREVRVARVVNGQLQEVPAQVFGEVRRGAMRAARVLLLVGSGGHQSTTYLLFHGNPDAELPRYSTDLATRGEGFALDIENDFYRASLSRQMGQLERLTMKREHNLELFAGGEGHGEPPGIDWAHDYVTSGNFQKMRITLWETCPDYEVVRGPLMTSIRRWGFPHSPVHPVFSPSRIHVDVEYRFYAGMPWFHKMGTMAAIQDVEADALRDDEWVFSGQSFTHMLWIGADGKVRTGAVPASAAQDLWGVGFYHEASHDSFAALFLEHSAEGLPGIRHTGSPIFFYKWHGHVWSRYPLPGKQVPAGAVLRQKNAYAALPYFADGAAQLEQLRHRLVNPLVVAAGRVDGRAVAQKNRLARAGEAGDAAVSKKALWEALRSCKDEQLYTADINVVDLGLVYDLRVEGDTVVVVMAMPHRGRPMIGYFAYGSGGNSMPVRQTLMKVAGVRRVVVEQTWHPEWTSNRLTEEGRRRLGLEA